MVVKGSHRQKLTPGNLKEDNLMDGIRDTSMNFNNKKKFTSCI